MRTVQIIRHGATSLNNEDVSVDRIRGWKDIPLSEEGRREAHKLGGELRKDPPAAMLSSDLKRAEDTAHIVGAVSGAMLREVTKAFRPWDVGDLAGEVSEKAIPILARYAENRSADPIPGGESFDAFRARFFAGLDAALQKYPGRIAIVTHHRDERLVHAWAAAGFPEDGSVDIKTFNRKGEHTGAIMKMEIPVAAVERAAAYLNGDAQKEVA